MHISNASKLLRLNESIHGIRIRYKDLFQAEKEILEDRLRVNETFNKNFETKNWTNSYGTLFKAIKMEKFLVSMLLSLVILVAVFNVVSMLVMTINQKRSQIAIMMTIGATQSFIKKIFVYFGVLIGISGTLLGLLLGLFLSFYLGSILNFIETVFNIQLLEVYFIDYFPVDIRLTWLISICLGAIFLTLLASIYPARTAAKVHPAEVLRYE